MAKFNFLERRSVAGKVADELREKYPKRSAAWIAARANQAERLVDVSEELRAPSRNTLLRRAR